MGPYDRCSIAAAVRLPKGRTRLLPFSPLVSIPISQELGSPSEPHPSRPPTPTRMGRHPKPPTETHAPLEGKSIPASHGPVHLPPPSRTRSHRGRLPIRILSRALLLSRELMAKRTRSRRIRAKAKNSQSMITDHFPGLIPASLPARDRQPTPTVLRPRSLPSLSWRRNPSFRMRLDPPQEP
jgi:hypothetical protein